MFENQRVPNSPAKKGVGLIVSSWHADLLASCETAFRSEISFSEARTEIIRLEAPGALEFPLLAKKMAKTGRFEAIALMALVADGGIYRHEFVANAVIEGIVRVSLETEVPVLSAVLTPHHFHDSKPHVEFFKQHLEEKGRELGRALQGILINLKEIDNLGSVMADF